jgi:hypothetical protein
MGGRYVNRIFVKSNWWRPPGCSLLYYKKTTSVIIYNLYDPNSARDEHSIHYELCRKDVSMILCDTIFYLSLVANFPLTILFSLYFVFICTTTTAII